MSTPAAEPAVEVRLRMQLRQKDMDRLGHLNHTVYLELFYEARTALLELIRSDDDRYVLARAEVDYVHEVRHAEGHVDVEVHVESVGRKSFTLLHEMRLPDGTMCARCRTVLVAWDVPARRSRELLPRERAALSARPAPPPGRAARPA